MNTFRRIAGIVLALLLVVLCIPTLTFAQTVTVSGSCGENVTWKLTDDGVITISGEGAMQDYWEPQQLPWFDYKDSIVKAVIEEGVTTVGGYAFAKCVNLKEFTLADSVTMIMRYAFYDTGLTEVVIPGRIEFTGDYAGMNAFSDCENLKKVTIQDGITGIPYSLFEGCTALEQISIPDSITYIGGEAFCCCSSLKEFYIPADAGIGRWAFSGCDNLQYIEFTGDAGIISMEAFEGCNTVVKFCGATPSIDYHSFADLTATMYYPAGHEAWTEEWLQAYSPEEHGGELTWVPYFTEKYEVLEGADSTVNIQEGKSLAIRVSGELDKFKEVQVDGVAVDAKNYTLTEGSTIVTFSGAYLKTLSAGEHKVQFVYTDGIAMTTLNIKSETVPQPEAPKPEQPEEPKPEQPEKPKPEQPEIEENPKTGDGVGIVCAALLLACLAFAVLVSRKPSFR